MTNVLIDTGHVLGLAALFAGLAVELALFRPRVGAAVARRLAVADAVYGLGLLLVLATGLLRLFAGDKPAAYYGQNAFFHVKMTVFVVLVALSVWPTRRFLRGRRAPDGAEVDYPPRLGAVLRIELALLLVVPLLAVLMARGFGFRA